MRKELPCLLFNTLRPRQNGRHFADDIFKCSFLNENVWKPIKISLKFVPKDPINNIPVLVQIMAWRRPGDKPLSESMMVSILKHICVTRPQWVITPYKKTLWNNVGHYGFHLPLPSNHYTPRFNDIYWYHLVRLSVCGQNRVRSVSSTILIGSISYLHILSSNFRRCVACNARFKIQKFEILSNF